MQGFFSDYDSYTKYFLHTLHVRGNKSKLNNYMHVFLLCISLTGGWNLIYHVNEYIFASRSEGRGVFQVLLDPRVVDSINNIISLRVNIIIPKIWEGHVDDFHLKVESFCYGLSRFLLKWNYSPVWAALSILLSRSLYKLIKRGFSTWSKSRQNKVYTFVLWNIYNVRVVLPLETYVEI